MEPYVAHFSQVLFRPVQSKAAGSGTTLCGAVRYGADRSGPERTSAVRSGSVRTGADRCGTERYRADRTGPVRTGAVRCGTAQRDPTEASPLRIAPDSSIPAQPSPIVYR